MLGILINTCGEEYLVRCGKRKVPGKSEPFVDESVEKSRWIPGVGNIDRSAAFSTETCMGRGAVRGEGAAYRLHLSSPLSGS